jgi:hypothetical protein
MLDKLKLTPIVKMVRLTETEIAKYTKKSNGINGKEFERRRYPTTTISSTTTINYFILIINKLS